MNKLLLRTMLQLFVYVIYIPGQELHGQTTFIVAKESDPGITTHEITSGGVTLGITDMGGGMINKFTLPGYGDIMDDIADRYGRGGQTAVRSFAHGGKYNPTQAGLTDASGTQCNITASPGKLVVDKRPCCLWRADGGYDFIEWEDLCDDKYNSDGGTSGHNSDVDGIDETNLEGKQATEVTSEFDFYCEYEDYMGNNGVDIACFRHYYEMDFVRFPDHCIDQFNDQTSVWNPAQVQSDISVSAPAGIHAGTDQDLHNFTHWTTLRTDNDLWKGTYRHVVQVSGAWGTEARTAERKFNIHIDGAQIFPLLIISNSTDINAGHAIGVFQPNSEIVAQQTVGGTYTDDRRYIAWLQDDPNRAGQNKFGFGGRTYGLLNRNRTPNNEPEKWRGEMYFLVGTPAEIYENALKINATYTSNSVASAPASPTLNSISSQCAVNLSWTPNASSDNVTMYEVWRSTSSEGAYEYVGATLNSDYTDSSSELGFDTQYFYKIRALNLGGFSNFSPEFSVDTNGCFALPVDNFSIEAIGETCLDKDNGQLIIEAAETHNYIAQYNGTDYNFTTNLKLENLSPGVNDLCISVEGQTYQQCYTLTIAEGTTVSGKANSDKSKTTIEITKGTAPFDVSVNGNVVLKTMFSTFDIDTKHGDQIEVKTDVNCEGIYTQTVQLFDVISISPNPSDGIFQLSIPIDLEQVSIEIYNNNSQLNSKNSYPINNGKAQLDLSHVSEGVYFIKVLVDTPVTLKIIKK
jgi:hypothetical protein